MSCAYCGSRTLLTPPTCPQCGAPQQDHRKSMDFMFDMYMGLTVDPQPIMNNLNRGLISVNEARRLIDNANIYGSGDNIGESNHSRNFISKALWWKS